MDSDSPYLAHLEIVLCSCARADKIKGGSFCNAMTVTIPSQLTLAVISLAIYFAQSTRKGTRECLKWSWRNVVALKCYLHLVKRTFVATLAPKSKKLRNNGQNKQKFEDIGDGAMAKHWKVWKETENVTFTNISSRTKIDIVFTCEQTRKSCRIFCPKMVVEVDGSRNLTFEVHFVFHLYNTFVRFFEL